MPSPKSMKIILMYKPNLKANRRVSGSKRYVAYFDGGEASVRLYCNHKQKPKRHFSADSKAD